MHPHTATKSSLELLQLERLLRREPSGLNPDQQQEAKHYFSKTEEYLEGEEMILQKLHHMWPLVEACFGREFAGVPQPATFNGDSPKPAAQKALDALGEIRQNLAIAEGRQAATGL
ncbi:hypothetical protein DES53_102482 [Roseimicrobium gellanilyticum]|uniref:Uncharacterized protein n=1 Tax=Roseimicrobium gellanilyticum TaxID=748857 RepID=A0A366HRH3_9BACT|nr:hypothetical protein [Roseimicrobium gellanilyticum]RBP46096.1 hypothetical protein DES53_102482 [Roseimicrobium gellanilyticum]